MKTFVKNIPVDFSFIKNIEGEPQRYENDTGSMLMCLEIKQAFQRKGAEDSSLNDIYLKLIQGAEEYAGERGAEFFSAWANIHLPGDAAPPHTHEHADFSSIYYIDVPEESGDLFIQNGNSYTPEEYAQGSITCEIEQIKPKQYDFIAVPGDYIHATGRNKSSVNRVSLVCDWYYLDTEKAKVICESSHLNITKKLTDAIEAADA